VLAALLALPAPVAGAVTQARVDRTAARLAVTAAPGAENDIVVAPAGTIAFLVRDRRAGVAAGDGCVPVDAQAVTCAAPSAVEALVDAGDGDDVVDAPTATRVDGGAGDDRLSGAATVTCGAGDDVVAGGAGVAAGPDCERGTAGAFLVGTVPVDRSGARLRYPVRCPGTEACAGRLTATVAGAVVGRTRPLRLAPGASAEAAVLLTERGWRTLAGRWESDVRVADAAGAGFTSRIESAVPGLRAFLPLVLELGPRVERIARAYDPRLGGAELLAKTLQGESRFRMDAVSRAGARGAAQFMPAARRIVLRRAGLDPWRSPREAVAAMVEHLLGRVNGKRGLYGYNPGGHPWYTRYVLGQPIPLLR
jgi:hypothetical protein